LKRVGRFDYHIEVGYPNEEVRKRYVEAKLKLGNFTTEENVEDLVHLTEGLSISSLKEVCILHVCLGIDIEKAVERVAFLDKRTIKPKERKSRLRE
jgi:ATP-dependent 26S proteasome regulatory subunit